MDTSIQYNYAIPNIPNYHRLTIQTTTPLEHRCSYIFPMGIYKGDRCPKQQIMNNLYCQRHDQRRFKYDVMFDDFLEYFCLIDPSKTPDSLYISCNKSVRRYSKCGDSDPREEAKDRIAQHLFSKDYNDVTLSDLIPYRLEYELVLN